MLQPNLFSESIAATWDAEPPSVRDSATSVAASKQIEPVTGSLRKAVYEFIRGRGTTGATDEEIQDGLELAANTERPRRRELQQAGWIRESGRTRPTRSGRKASVWVLTEKRA